MQKCPCFLGVLDLCYLCSFDISVSSLLSMCHIYFYVVTLSSLCLPSSARVSLLPRCPRSMSSAFILHLCNLYTKMCPPLGQDCPCFLCVHDLCHLCLFDISLLCLLIICHLCFNDATLSCLCLLSSLRLSLLPGCPHSVSYFDAILFMPSQSVCRSVLASWCTHFMSSVPF